MTLYIIVVRELYRDYELLDQMFICILCVTMWHPVPRAQSRDGGGRVVGGLRRCWSHPLSRLLRSWWRVIVVVLTPLLFLPIPIVLKDDVSKVIL